MEAIVGRPLILFVNGQVGIPGGPQESGRGYWFDGQLYFNAAASFFGVTQNRDEDFLDGQFLTSANLRETAGYNAAAANYISWKSKFKNNPIYLVGHSMGCAYAAGVSKYILEKGDKVGGMVLLSCFQGNGFSVNSSIPSYELEYMYWDKALLSGNCEPERDPVINVFARNSPYNGINGISKFGVSIGNYSISTVHGSTNGVSVFSKLVDLRNVTATYNWNGGLPYHSQSNTITKFYQINDKIIWSNHPQFNPRVPNFIDSTIPCKN